MSVIKNDYFLKDSGYSNYSHSVNLPRHRWYYVKEGFSPNWVEKAISEMSLSQDDLILDPFSGSGTVPLVASTKRMYGVGFEVNPFLAFLGKTKLTKVGCEIVVKNYSKIIGGINKGATSNLENFSTFSRSRKKEKWLFNTSVLKAFEGGWSASNSIEDKSRSLFQLALIGAAMDNCNATRDGKCLRYRKNWEDNRFGKRNFIESFESRLDCMKEDLSSNPLGNQNGKIYYSDSRLNIQSKRPNRKKFKLCVTSPPYLNSFDYTDIYRPELFWGKFVHDNVDLNRLRHKTVRSHVPVDWKEPIDSDFGVLYKEIYEQIEKKKSSLWNKKIPIMIQAYFEDMKSVLQNLKNEAAEDASLWIIVSTSAYAGIEIPVDLIIAEIATQMGWYLKEVGVLRHLRSSNQHNEKCHSANKKLRESVVVLNHLAE